MEKKRSAKTVRQTVVTVQWTPLGAAHPWLVHVVAPDGTLQSASYATRREADESARDIRRRLAFERHQAADPHCTCNDCIEDFARKSDDAAREGS